LVVPGNFARRHFWFIGARSGAAALLADVLEQVLISDFFSRARETTRSLD
jgi:hypothetical protein